MRDHHCCPKCAIIIVGRLGFVFLVVNNDVGVKLRHVFFEFFTPQNARATRKGLKSSFRFSFLESIAVQLATLSDALLCSHPFYHVLFYHVPLLKGRYDMSGILDQYVLVVSTSQ
ncbi:hypothetical protein Tco_0805355 [Tanacetum coccineum]